MTYIRKFKEKDKENLHRICIETSSLPTETEKERKFLTLMYNDYYTEAEPDNCIVATNEEDEAVGYVICAENFDRYYKIFTKIYLPEIKELGISYFVASLGEIMLHRAFSKKYPAHLHIDILPVCQGKGVGSALINELKYSLAEKDIHSVMLSCGLSNTRAIKFYKKNGFKVVKKILGSCIMACEF